MRWLAVGSLWFANGGMVGLLGLERPLLHGEDDLVVVSLVP
jgi:hypothetical protein